MEEPYVIVRIHMDGNYRGELEPMEIVGCSNGDISQEHISEAKTIVVCESRYNIAHYSNGGTADSEEIDIYCLNAATGDKYYIDKLNCSDSHFGYLSAEGFPEEVYSTPHYKYSKSEIKEYVEDNFDKWRSKKIVS